MALKIKSFHNYTLIESEIGTDQDKETMKYLCSSKKQVSKLNITLTEE